MAHKKAGGSSRNGRDCAGQRLGVKLFGGQKIDGGQHDRAPARHRVPSGRECRHGQGPYAFRAYATAKSRSRKASSAARIVSVITAAQSGGEDRGKIGG